MIINYNKECKEICYPKSKIFDDLRFSAECHKKIRNELNKFLRPGLKYTDICKFVDDKINHIMGKNNIDQGIAFPLGISINNIFAHDSAYLNDNRTINKNDLIKFDLGIQKNGMIIDSAYTFSFEKEKYKALINATREATWNAIKFIGPDVLISEVSEIIRETIISHEIEINGKIYNINPVKGLGGHNIKKYKIHGGQIILCENNYPEQYKNQRMLENEIYAIETFSTTGSGEIIQSNIPVTHFMLNNTHSNNFKFHSTPKVYNWIINNRSTLPFNSTWITNHFENKKDIKVSIAINELLKTNVITAFPALEDKIGTYSSQCEHTIYLHDFGKEIFSSSDDY